MDYIWIKLNNIRMLKEFVEDCSQVNERLEVMSGEHMADAKSMLGLMTLNLSQPLKLIVYADRKRREKIFEYLRKYWFFDEDA